MACGICKQAGHNRRTCIRRKVEEAARAADGEIDDRMKEEITTAIYENWKTDAALEAAIDMAADFFIPGLGICIRLTKSIWRLSKK